MSADSLDLKPTGTSVEQLSAYSALLSHVFGPQPKFSVASLTWLYRDNPDGEVVGFDAWSGERLVAHYVTIPMRANVRGREARGLLSLNTATHPDFQGKGLFTKLASATYDAATQRGFKFVFGVANANSTPGFTRKLAFQNVRPLEAGGLLRPPRTFAPTPTDFQVAWSREGLTWRLANPVARYSVARRGELLEVRAATNVPLLACAAWIPGDVGVTATAKASPLPPLFIGLDPRFPLGARGFLRVPDRLRPSPLNMIWRSLEASMPSILDAEAVVLNFLDFDPY